MNHGNAPWSRRASGKTDMTKGAKTRFWPDAGLVLAAAGSGVRFGSGTSKLFLPLQGKPVFLHALVRFLTVVPPEHVVLVVRPGGENAFRRVLRDAGIEGGGAIRLVSGGETRQQSVIAGLEALPAEVAFVAVHDAARPLATSELLRRCLQSAREHGTGIAARPVTDTIKLVDGTGRVEKTLRRDRLWAAETPQVFAFPLLKAAYAAVENRGIAVTDDAQAVEEYGKAVRLVRADSPNPKITYAYDLVLVELLAGRHGMRGERGGDDVTCLL